MKGIVIAATKSGSGKTTITLALLAAFVKRGFKTVSFKVGPDFIDPGHHTRITGHTCRNLDGWMLSPEYNRNCFTESTKGADVAVVEGVMGLFDGYSGRSEEGSTAQMAKQLGLPVLLVMDSSSMARSAAAVASGFENFDPDLEFAGIVFNKVSSMRHELYLKEAVKDHVAMPVLGAFKKNDNIMIPERHLGLFTSDDHPLSSEVIERLALFAEESMDIDSLYERMKFLPSSSGPQVRRPAKKRARIGVAKDSAFCFYYQDNIDILESSGAEIVYFSPAADKRLPGDLNGLYLGGGYPELMAEELSSNRSLKSDIYSCFSKGMPILAECGGFMYLCKGITDERGRSYGMCGCFPFETRMKKRLAALGYREVLTLSTSILGPAGTLIRGHEFHYSEIEDEQKDVKKAFETRARAGEKKKTCGYLRKNCIAGYVHLHFGSCPEAARSFVDACAMYRRERK